MTRVFRKIYGPYGDSAALIFSKYSRSYHIAWELARDLDVKLLCDPDKTIFKFAPGHHILVEVFAFPYMSGEERLVDHDISAHQMAVIPSATMTDTTITVTELETAQCGNVNCPPMIECPDPDYPAVRCGPGNKPICVKSGPPGES